MNDVEFFLPFLGGEGGGGAGCLGIYIFGLLRVDSRLATRMM